MPFNSVSLLVLEKRRKFVTLKRRMFFFIDMNNNFHSVSGVYDEKELQAMQPI